MTVRDSAMRLLNLGPPELPEHLERVPVASIDDGLMWLHERGWRPETDHERRQLVKWLLFHRWRYAAEWHGRGGTDV